MEIRTNLTANSSSVYYLTPDDPMRDIYALLDDYTVLVDATHESNSFFLSFIAKLRNNKVEFAIKPVELSVLQASYKNNTNFKDNSYSSRQNSIIALIKRAVEIDASDIHFVRKSRLGIIQFRINGDLEKINEITADECDEYCSAIYQSMCDVAEHSFQPRKKQDARLKREYLATLKNLFGTRVSTTPTDDGYYFVMRLLKDRSNENLSLERLGYNEKQISQINLISQKKGGIKILSGETGSGKSTTIEFLLKKIIEDTENKKRILTVEDPPEYAINGAIQTPILCDKNDPDEISLAWTRSISSAVRLDPDIIMIGEVRDISSAKAAISAAMTGHGVYTTLHANSCIDILTRLADMGVESSLLFDNKLITALINQNLTKVLCQQCKIPVKNNENLLKDDLIQRLDVAGCDMSNIFLKGAGCKHCRSGIAGRTVVAEILIPTANFMKVFKNHGAIEAREYWINEMKGMTKSAHMREKINQGILDPRIAETDICLIDEDLQEGKG